VNGTGARLIHELAMLLAVCLLAVWRFTGVPLHEYLAAALGAAVFVHLLMQRSWVAANVRKLGSGVVGRAKLNMALNGCLCIAFTAAMVSGVAISKVLLPGTEQPAKFLKWHEIHDVSSKFVLLFVGLHAALNWDPLVASARALFQGRREVPAARPPAVAKSGLRYVALYAASLVIVATIVTGAVYGIENVLPSEDFVLTYTRDGQLRRVPPPHDLVELRADQRSPNVSGGLPKLAVTLGILAVLGVTGRKVLRLRL
jgi:hypothetical protein